MQLQNGTNDAYRNQASSLLEVLATTKQVQDRHKILAICLVAFDHFDTDSHNDICVSGGISLVAQWLNMQFTEAANLSDSDFDALDSTCKLLAFLFRCDTNYGSSAFEAIGADVVSIVVGIVSEHQYPEENSGPFQLVRKLAELDQVNLERAQKSFALIRLLHQLVRDEYDSPSLTLIGCTLLRGLTKNPENNIGVAKRPSLLHDVVSLVCRQNVSEHILFEAMECLKQLSLDWSVKIEILKISGFLSGTLQVLQRYQSKLLPEKVALSAIETVSCLATDAMCRHRMCSYEKGKLIKSLAHLMKIPALRGPVTRALLRLVDQDTGPRIVKKHPDIVRILMKLTNTKSDHIIPESPFGAIELFSLKYSVTSPSKIGQCSETSDDGEFLIAANFLYRIARHIKISDELHPAFISALTKLATSKDTKSREYAAKGLREQSRTKAGRFFLARTPHILDTLIVLANDRCRTVQASATEALLWFVSDSANVRPLAQRSDVLQTFVSNSENLEECLETCRSAIQAIISIVMCEVSLARIAKTLGLVEVLTKYGISDDSDANLKYASLQCVIMLAPLM